MHWDNPQYQNPDFYKQSSLGAAYNEHYRQPLPPPSYVLSYLSVTGKSQEPLPYTNAQMTDIYRCNALILQPQAPLMQYHISLLTLSSLPGFPDIFSSVPGQCLLQCLSCCIYRKVLKYHIPMPHPVFLQKHLLTGHAGKGADIFGKALHPLFPLSFSRLPPRLLQL